MRKAGERASGPKAETRAPTSADVARLAGVSRATISFVLNGQADRIRISTETRERVVSAAAALGYTPNHAARSLRRRATRIVAFLLPTIGNPYFSEVVEGAHDAAKRLGYSLAAIPFGEDLDELGRMALLQGMACDGIVVAGHANSRSQELSRLAARGVSVVVLQETSADPAVRKVGVDFEAGGYLATRHLIGLGHRRIAHVTQEPKREGSGRARIDGYRRALAEAGLSPEPDLVVLTENSMQGGADAVPRLLALGDRRPTAVFAYNDQLAVGLLHGLREKGFAVPDDMALVGFDGVAVGRFVHPALTTVDTPRADLGRLALEALVAGIEGREPEEPELLPVRLVVRESCGASMRRRREGGPPDGTG